MNAIDVKATVILPAYNEAAALPEVLASLFAAIDAGTEVIVVDDGSSDSTAEVASRFPCRLVRHKWNQGKGAAVRTGLLEAQGGFIIVMDADNSYPADAVPRMIELSHDYDLVRCARQRDQANMPLVNRVGNRLFDYLLRISNGLEGVDHLSGLYGLRREALSVMDFSSDGFDLEVEIGIKARAHRLRCISFPIPYAERIGKKKLRPYHDGWAILRRVMALTLLYNPGRMFVLPGVLLWLMSLTLILLLIRGPIMTPYAEFSYHSFIAATLGATTGFQIMVFGIVAALYGVEHGAAPGGWLLRISSHKARLTVELVGAVCAMVGVATVVAMVVKWISTGAGAFHDTNALVMGGALVSWGTQAVLAGLFVSMFADKLEKAAARRAREQRQKEGTPA